MITQIITVLLISIACFGIAVLSITGSDTVHKQSILRSWGTYWESKLYSSSNKWKNGSKAQGEKFPFSSTLLSPFTDAWHMGLFLAIIGLSLAGILTGFQLARELNFGTILSNLMLWFTTYGIVFNLMYHYWLTNNPIPAWQWGIGFLTIIIVGSLGLNFGLFSTGVLVIIGLAPIILLVILKLLILIYKYLIKFIKWLLKL